MTPWRAQEIVYGLAEEDDVTYEEWIDAWETIVLSGVVSTMPGWVGRRAQVLVDAGEICQAKKGG